MDFGHSNGKIYQKLRSINRAYIHAIPSKLKFGLVLPTCCWRWRHVCGLSSARDHSLTQMKIYLACRLSASLQKPCQTVQPSQFRRLDSSRFCLKIPNPDPICNRDRKNPDFDSWQDSCCDIFVIKENEMQNT